MSRELASVVLVGMGAVALAFVIGANIYEQMICVPQWRTPEGMTAWRVMTSGVHPGYFFLTFAPTSLLLLGLGTAIGWNHPVERNLWALGATAAVLAGLILTKVHFLPLNSLLFLHPPPEQTHEEVLAMLRSWVGVNYARVAITLGGLISALVALRR